MNERIFIYMCEDLQRENKATKRSIVKPGLTKASDIDRGLKHCSHCKEAVNNEGLKENGD